MRGCWGSSAPAILKRPSDALEQQQRLGISCHDGRHRSHASADPSRRRLASPCAGILALDAQGGVGWEERRIQLVLDIAEVLANLG